MTAVKDALELYRATCAASLSSEAIQSPLRAMLYYCDAQFISQLIGALGSMFLESKNAQNNPKEENVLLSDIIPSFRRLGEDILTEHLVSIFDDTHIDDIFWLKAINGLHNRGF